ncbi:MAG: sigma 54-interacting transcriptional regulator [Candidatus Nanoarchaeia archaeon]
MKSEFPELSVLNQISHVLLHQRNVSELLKEVLDILQDQMGFTRATLTLKRGEYLFIEASNGLTEEERRRGQYKIGEGITGKVAATGKPRIIPDVSKEPEFLDKTKARKSAEVAFICVPIISPGEGVIGTLSIDHPKTHEKQLYKVLYFLSIVANIIADAVSTFRSEIEERELLRAENERLKRELGEKFRPSNIIGNCSSMKLVYAMIAQVADSPATVLIRGESGTGKELVARAIHYASPRASAPFVAVNCAALPETLIESELFGHEKGAFTGAMQQRKGRFEVATGGTLFLDEIGDISLPVQVKLLRVLQERVFERVGGHEPIQTNVRIIAATSRNLEQEMQEGRFREDLFYRLNIFPIHLPPLRDRKSDIILLAEHFLAKYNALYSKNIRRISTPAINMMMMYHWPGNVRELENCIERAVLVSSDDVINAHDLPPSLQTAQTTNTPIMPETGANFEAMVRSYERELIVDALKNHRGNVAASARALGLTQRIMHYKIEKIGIDVKSFKT